MRTIWYCKFCVRQSVIEHDGVNGRCVGCRTHVVNTGDIFHAAWFPLAEVIAGQVSRPAGAALRVLEKADESAPADWKPLLNFAALVIMGVVGGLVVKEVFGSN